MLASYGFLLIYSLTKDMSTLAKNVDPKMASNMDAMSSYIGAMSSDIAIIRHQSTDMVTHIKRMDGNITVLNGSIHDMNRSRENAIPLPATLTIELAKHIGRKTDGFGVNPDVSSWKELSASSLQPHALMNLSVSSPHLTVEAHSTGNGGYRAN